LWNRRNASSTSAGVQGLRAFGFGDFAFDDFGLPAFGFVIGFLLALLSLGVVFRAIPL
jgi:hypothetical protein